MAKPMPMMMIPCRSVRISVALAALLLLSACATAKPSPPVSGLDTPNQDASLYGLVLAGQAAAVAGRNQEAADYLAQALEIDPENTQVAERAFAMALMSGNVHRAAQLASDKIKPDSAVHPLSVVTRAVDALASDPASPGGKTALQLLSSNTVSGPYQNAALLMLPLSAAAAGDWNTALALPASEGNAAVALFAQANQALLYERAGRKADAAKLYQALIAADQGGNYLTLAYGAFLERQGQRQEAKAIYDAALLGDPQNQLAKDALSRLQARKPGPPLATIRQTAASLMMASAMAASNQRQSQASLVFVQLALRLDPKRDEAILMAGELLGANRDHDSARSMFAKVSEKSPQYVQARSRMAWSLNQSGETNAAIALARETVAKNPSNIIALSTLADILRVNSLFEESIIVVNQLIANKPEPSWGDYFSRGVSLDRVGRWTEAEKDLKKAFEMNPNEPDVLNYLGYSWIERGENLEQAVELVKRAVAAKPDSGAITDSLGWGYYKLGNFQLAVELLERAAQLDASDPDLNNHLGDAYWQVGRKIEAQFQWNRVLTLSPSDKLKGEVEAKLLSGLPALKPVPLAPQSPAKSDKPMLLPKGGTTT
jgi:tetratricopeptide (TPR) repeat protein